MPSKSSKRILVVVAYDSMMVDDVAPYLKAAQQAAYAACIWGGKDVVATVGTFDVGDVGEFYSADILKSMVGLKEYENLPNVFAFNPDREIFPFPIHDKVRETTRERNGKRKRYE